MKRLVLFWRAALLTVLLAGCGGSGVDEAAPGSGLLGASQGAGDTTALRYGDVIYLKSAYFRQYLSAQGGTSVEKAVAALDWERWQVVDPANAASTAAVRLNDPVALYSPSRKTYLSAQQGGAMEHVSSRQAWELWKFRDRAHPQSTMAVGDASAVLLSSAEWGTYLSAQDGKTISHVSQPLDWEQWLIVSADRPAPVGNGLRYGDTITARSAAFRTYLSAQMGTSVELADHPESWEQWELVKAADRASTAAVQFKDKLILYSPAKGTFLSAQDGGEARQAAKPQSWEEWQILDAGAPASTAAVVALDDVAFHSAAKGTYLSAQQRVAGQADALAAWEHWIVAPGGYFRHWMSREASNIKDKKLREITLPASHDAGTWTFLDEVSHDPETVAGVLKGFFAVVDRFVDALTRIQVLGYTVDLGSGIVHSLKERALHSVYANLAAVAKATRRDVRQQLDEGIRWLDLRIDLRSGGAYTYHFLTGVEVEGVLDAVREFLAGTQGEIVVLEMSHFAPELGGAYGDLAHMVKSKLGTHLYAYSAGATPLETTYGALVGELPARQSRVIVIMDTWGGAPDVHNDGFWKSSDLKFFGSYANKSDRSAMLADQRSKFASRGTAPFKLFLTLTGQPAELAAVVAWGIYWDYRTFTYQLVASLLPTWIPQVDEGLKSLISSTIKSVLSTLGLPVPSAAGWTSLYELSQRINPDLHTILESNFQRSDTGHNELSVIYADFIDTTLLVETAIRYSRLPKK